MMRAANTQATEEEGAGDGEPDAAEPTDRGPDWLIANVGKTNLCDDIDASTLAALGSKVCDEYEIDVNSRKAAGWEARNQSALKLAMQVKETKNYPWPNASNIKYPLLAEAAIQFNARAYGAVVDGNRVVKSKVLGKPDDQKRAKADRISAHMSYQLLDEMEEWEEDTDQLLLILPITGTVFRKTYFDPAQGRNCSEIILADKLVVNYWAKPLAICPRVTQVCEYYPHEIEERFRAGTWRKVELGVAANDANDPDAKHTFLEQHRLWDLDGDGYPEPYIVTVHKETTHVVRIYARYDKDAIKVNKHGEVSLITPVRYFTKYGFIPSMDGSFYDIGFGMLLDAMNETINSTLNQLMDAGHLQNTGGGLIGSGVSIKSGVLRFTPGEWKKVEVTGLLKDNIVTLPTPQPSSVLFELLGMLIESAKGITATQDILTGEAAKANMPVGTTLAMIEQGLKVFTAIWKRIRRALKQELDCLFRLNSLYLDQDTHYAHGDVEGVIQAGDYDPKAVNVLPVSDPTMVSDAQKLARAQFLAQFRQDPLMNPKEINRRMLEAAQIEDIPAVFAQQPPGPDPAALKIAHEAKVEEENLALATRKQTLDEQRFQLERDRFDLEKANAIAANTERYALALAGLGKAPMAGADADILDGAHQLAVSEVEGKTGHVEAIQPAPSTAPVQSGDPGGMAGPPDQPAVPPVPEGPAGGPGPELGGGQPDVGGAPDQSPPDGGVGGPQVA